jgi:hypothetical protein
MKITVNKKTGKVSLQTGKFTYQHKITFGDILVLALLASWFLFDVIIWIISL